MHYYTNVQRYKDFILARGVKNGERYIKRLKYEPTLYIPTNKQTAFKSIKCANVPPICPAPIKVIFFLISPFYYFKVGITNSGSDLTPEGHLEVIVFNLV